MDTIHFSEFKLQCSSFRLYSLLIIDYCMRSPGQVPGRYRRGSIQGRSTSQRKTRPAETKARTSAQGPKKTQYLSNIRSAQMTSKEETDQEDVIENPRSTWLKNRHRVYMGDEVEQN